MSALPEDVVDEARFLCARLREFMSELKDDSAGREFYGHVEPSLVRLERTLQQQETCDGK